MFRTVSGRGVNPNLFYTVSAGFCLASMAEAVRLYLGDRISVVAYAGKDIIESVGGCP